MSAFPKNFDDTIIETINSDDDEPIDWQKLSSMLSPDALSALRGHMEDSDECSPTSQIIPGSGSHETCVKQSSLVKPTANNAVFKEQSYWEERFSEEEEYDWLLSYEQLQSHIIPLLNVEESILIVGCGNSRLSAGLYDAGFTNITNIDFSDIVIEKMKSLHEIERPLMKWLFMDMTEMSFEYESFDVVIDKASMDALMVDEGDVWHPNQGTIDITDKMCRGVSNILKKGTGRFVQLSFAQPHFRTKYLMGQHLTVDPSSLSSVKISPFDSTVGFCDIYKWTLSYSTINTEAGCLNSFLYVMKL